MTDRIPSPAWLWSHGYDMPQRASMYRLFDAALAAGCDVFTFWSFACTAAFDSLQVLGRRCEHGRCLRPAIGTWGERHRACVRHMPRRTP